MKLHSLPGAFVFGLPSAPIFIQSKDNSGGALLHNTLVSKAQS